MMRFSHCLGRRRGVGRSRRPSICIRSWRAPLRRQSGFERVGKTPHKHLFKCSLSTLNTFFDKLLKDIYIPWSVTAEVSQKRAPTELA